MTKYLDKVSRFGSKCQELVGLETQSLNYIKGQDIEEDMSDGLMTSRRSLSRLLQHACKKSINTFFMAQIFFIKIS